MFWFFLWKLIIYIKGWGLIITIIIIIDIMCLEMEFPYRLFRISKPITTADFSGTLNLLKLQ
jgi:hypothetical protein